MAPDWPASSIVAVTTSTAFALTASIVTWQISKRYHQKQLHMLEQKWQQRRQEERTGRIRAEIKLRTLSKQQQQEATANAINDNSKHIDKIESDVMKITPIGHVVSPFTKRMGTPRQSQLVPSARGFIQLHPTICPPECLDGIEEYSHVWLVFQFHANTTVETATKRSKIRPPRAPAGQKVGVLATRSPHRPNPLGLSLVCVREFNAASRQLHVTGLDLVHGTPVYDIKPCVPWDVPGYYDNLQASRKAEKGENSTNDAKHASTVHLKVPFWVDQDDEITQVDFTEVALKQLEHMVSQGRLEPLYTVQNNGVSAAHETLRQILAQDPRSSHKGLKQNQRGTTTKVSSSSSEDVYRLIFGQCQVDFVVVGVVTDHQHEAARVEVVSVGAVDFDSSSYVDGIPVVTSGVLTNGDI